MSLSSPFIHRPVGTTLLTLAVLLAGALAYFLLPVSALPEIEFPTIQVSAELPGASPSVMASAVATPLERQFGRIAGITEMTSASSQGQTSITMQFDLDRNIDAAARDVQAAINAARGQLPANLPRNPYYRKSNPADSPILIMALSSDTYPIARVFDAASSILQQKLAQIQGVGQVRVGGGAEPAVRVELNPTVLNHLGVGLGEVRDTLANANANRPKGSLADDTKMWSLSTTDQLMTAAEYKPLIVSYRNGAAVRLEDIADVVDSVEDVRTVGITNGAPAIVLIVYRQPGANIIETVDRLRGLMPQLRAEIPAGIDLEVVMDRTTTIRASVEDVQFSLVLSIGLVVLVIFVFLRNVRVTLIPSVAVPVSLVGTFGVMYLLGYTLDNLSLMALTIATGFVVDDAIVVIENIIRHVEDGASPLEASLLGSREIGFTVLSISVSLVAVFIPILLMGGIIGRLFRQFAITLSVAILVSLVVSLTTTPMLCAIFLKPASERRPGLMYRTSQKFFDALLAVYSRTLHTVLRFRGLTLAVTLGTIALTVYLYAIVPKGFFPQQDAGRLIGSVQSDQDVSFQALKRLLTTFSQAVSEDPAVAAVTAYSGGRAGSSNAGRMYASLKPLEERDVSTEEVIARLRKRLSSIPGSSLVLQSVQDLRIGGRVSSAQYQYSLEGDNVEDLLEWGPKVLEGLRGIPLLADVTTDQETEGLEAALTVDRTTAARLGISQRVVDNTLYDAFGQRQVSTMYAPLNQYHVVMGVQQAFWENPQSLRHIYVRNESGALVPLSAIARHELRSTALSVNHSGFFPSVTISFNLRPGVALGAAIEQIRELEAEMGMPATIRGSFAGAAKAFEASLANQPLLILAALLSVYIVLGILYESYIHPITILSTLPSAGVGAILALMLCRMDLDVMAVIGIILLIGIVKKNAIMMIDFALELERREGRAPEDAIHEACVLRFRPIIMTTMAALLGALPLAIGTGVGSELRRPMGVAIVGGLIFSQMLTLYTTPVVYLYMERMRLAVARWRGKADELEVAPHIPR